MCINCKTCVHCIEVVEEEDGLFRVECDDGTTLHLDKETIEEECVGYERM